VKYAILYDNGHVKALGLFDIPDHLPQCGEVYEWTRAGYTLGNYGYVKGDRMTVLERTGHVPHHRESSLGNLLVKGKHHTSVWTCFEACIAEGSLKLVENP
jgi:hypothetical protein